MAVLMIKPVTSPNSCVPTSRNQLQPHITFGREGGIRNLEDMTGDPSKSRIFKLWHIQDHVREGKLAPQSFPDGKIIFDFAIINHLFIDNDILRVQY